MKAASQSCRDCRHINMRKLDINSTDRVAELANGVRMGSSFPSAFNKLNSLTPSADLNHIYILECSQLAETVIHEVNGFQWLNWPSKWAFKMPCDHKVLSAKAHSIYEYFFSRRRYLIINIIRYGTVVMGKGEWGGEGDQIVGDFLY